MSPRPKKSCPHRPYISWRWVLEKAPVVKSLWRENAVATATATVLAKDNHCLLGYITPTGTANHPDRITIPDVRAYMAAGKPENETSEARYPNCFELLFEINDAKLHVSQHMGYHALSLWTYGQFEMVDGVRTPVVIMEWACTHNRRPLARGLRMRDKRFGIIPPRANHPWEDTWSPRSM